MIRTFADLAAHGIDPLLVRALEADPGGDLLPVQRRAAARTGLLRGGHLVLVAPTASGKTMAAELAALRAIARGGQALYLAPTRALAAEKAAEFARRYAPAGVRVGWTAGDRRADDDAILDGAAHLAVAVVEKAIALANRRPGWLEGLGLLAVDEAQLLGDPDRGGALDLLLSLWRALPPDARPQLVALSAVLPNAREVAAWLGAELLECDDRPAPLLEGVLDLATGVFHHRVAGRAWPVDQEALLEEPRPGADPPTPVEAAVRLAERLGPVLAFCATRHDAWRSAEEARLLQAFPGADDAAAQVRRAGPGMAAQRLADLLDGGVGVHTADLAGPMRRAVEDAFRWGRLPLLFATPTLDQGVNLPAAAVVHAPGCVAPSGRGRVPLSRARFANQGGRAGRSGQAGRSILLAGGELERLRLWRSIVDAPAEPVRSPLARRSLLGVAASLAASGRAGDRADLARFAAGTFAATHAKDAVAEAMARAASAGVAFGLWAEDADGRIEPTLLGAAVAASGIDPATARCWATLLQGARGAPPSAARLFLVSLAAEFDAQPLAVAPWDRRRNRWPDGLRARLDGGDDLSTRLAEMLDAAGGSPFAGHRNARRALLLDDWLGGDPCEAVEESHGVPGGQLERLASTAAWLAGAAARIAAAAGAGRAVAEAFDEVRRDLARRAAELSGEPPLEAPAPSPPAAAPAAPSPAGDGAIDLAFPGPDNGEVRWRGRLVRLTPQQFALLRLLAERAGETVRYEEIDERLWPDAKVERQMVYHHRKELVDRLGAGAADAIVTDRRWGLRLDLAPERIALPARASAA